MKASDVMTRELACVSPTTPVADIARLLLARGVSAVPVVGPAGEPLGIVSESDLVAREEIGTLPRGSWWLTLLSDPTRQAGDFVRTHGLSAKDVMTVGAIDVSPEASLAEVATLMTARKIRRVFVIEGGRLAGVITRADLLRALASRIAVPATATRDGEVLAEIERRLAEAPWARNAWVTVSMRDGRVELSGAVESEAQHRALELLVRGVPGVVEVVDHLRRRDGTGVTLY
jgi:CBS domain-containing protein